MTAFLAEARRLGVRIPSFIPPNPWAGREHDDEGLCVTDCGMCRRFRNEVREALAAEQAAADQVFIDWFFADPEPEPKPAVDLAYILTRDYPDEAVGLLDLLLPGDGPEERRMYAVNLVQVGATYLKDTAKDHNGYCSAIDDIEDAVMHLLDVNA